MQAIDYKNKGNEALSNGNSKEAIEFYTKAIELDPNEHVYYSNRSAAYLSLNDYEKALEDANQCIKINNQWSKGYARKGAVLHYQKKYEEAKSAYEEGLKYDPNNTACQNGIQEIADIMKNCGPTGEGTPGTGNSGTSGMGGNNPLAGLFGPDMFGKIATNPKLSHLLADQELVRKLQDLQNDPNKLSQYLTDQRIMMILSEFMGINLSCAPGGMARGPGGFDGPEGSGADMPTSSSSHNNTTASAKTTPSPSANTKIPTPTPTRSEPLSKQEEFKQQGNAHYKKREFELALECYQKAQELDPTNMSYVTNEAAAYFEMQKYDKCIEKCEESIKIGREQRADYALIAKAYTRIGNAYVKQADEKNVELLQKACQAYERALVENRTKDVEMKLKSAQQAVRKAEALSYVDPEKGLEAKNQGNECFKQGNFPKAVEYYTDAIKRDPENPIYYANRAAALTKLTSFNDAKADCEKALSLDPNYVKAYSRKGAIEFFMKEYHKAMESYKKGLELDPENTECRDGMQRVMYAIQNNNNEEINKERAEHALADPEIQQILRDPVMQSVLQDIQQNPANAAKHLSNPEIMKKIEKLIASGVLQTK